MSYLILLIINLFFGGLALWIAARLTSVDLKLKETIIAVMAASVASVFPLIGWPLSIIVLFFMLKVYSDAKIWPDIILLVIISRLVAFVMSWFIPGNF